MLHPNKFFEWCAIRIGIDTFEIFDNELKKKLMNIHPKNFIKSKIKLPVYKVCVGYETSKGNYKETEKYMVLNNNEERGYDDMWADMFARDYESDHDESIKNIQVLSVDLTLDSLLENCPKNQTIGDNLVRAWSKINSPKYKKEVCTISGGSDSDIMLDICNRCDKDDKVEYVWFDTGLEYQATKEHLKFLEQKYSIEIKKYKAIKPIPISCRQYGQPFISKNVSEMIDRLQKHGFQWEDEPLWILLPRYCKWSNKKQDWIGCKGALMWWCNSNESPRFCIKFNKWLKEFMIENHPTFKISSKCCKYAKKDVLHKLVSNEGYDLNIFGVRKAEGGIRGTSYKSCFDESDSCDNYRPLFWYANSDKEDYEKYYGVTHSKCYTEYGLKRTGCAGCPFGRDFEQELGIIEKYEPKLFVAVNNIFGDSYEYTRKYREFCKIKDREKKQDKKE